MGNLEDKQVGQVDGTEGSSQRPPSELVDEYQGLVFRIVEQVQNQIAVDVPQDDLVQYGYEGLLEAGSRFEPDSTASFSTFAYYRIRGAIYDGCRREGWTSRNNACTVEDCASINEYLSDKQSSHSTGQDTESDFSETVSELEETVSDCVVICLLEKSDMESARASEEAPQQSQFEEQQIHRALEDAVETLREPDSKVIERYYFGEETMDHIAEQLGYSKSWVSRINSRAIRTIRDYLAEEYGIGTR